MQTITRKEIQRIASLSQRKERELQGRFKVEGFKIIGDLLLRGFPFAFVYSCLEDHTMEDRCLKNGTAWIKISDKELAAMSSLQTPQGMLAIAPITDSAQEKEIQFPAIALEGIQDPGNVGTIIRIADWFGIKHILADKSCADLYNPKVLQASMGSFCNISWHSSDHLAGSIAQFKRQYPTLRVLATSLSGKPLVRQSRDPFLLCMGNESKGLSEEMLGLATELYLIPGDRERFAESLNVGIACGIACASLSGSEPVG
ncbi:MAG: TrmH family RNA methyltransferase [Bacteroidota bacterium]|jgi:TrmH family RNA methyltransferase